MTRCSKVVIGSTGNKRQCRNSTKSGKYCWQHAGSGKSKTKTTKSKITKSKTRSKKRSTSIRRSKKHVNNEIQLGGATNKQIGGNPVDEYRQLANELGNAISIVCKQTKFENPGELVKFYQQSQRAAALAGRLIQIDRQIQAGIVQMTQRAMAADLQAKQLAEQKTIIGEKSDQLKGVAKNLKTEADTVKRAYEAAALKATEDTNKNKQGLAGMPGGPPAPLVIPQGAMMVADPNRPYVPGVGVAPPAIPPGAPGGPR